MHPLPPSSQLPEQNDAYRTAKPLPIAVQDRCNAIVDEGVWSMLFDLLSATLTSGAGTNVPAHVPSPTYLALAATLAVHPSLTTRTAEVEKHRSADKALTYLRQVHRILGPAGASFAKAFRFTERRSLNTSRGPRGRTRQHDEPESSSFAELRSPFVEKYALWNNADDFWSIVGWALNCSVTCKPRWERWRLWLDFMLGVLEDDFYEHSPSSSATSSIIADYFRQFGNGRSNKRRLMRAILADGSQTSLDEFKEIWKDETKPPKKPKYDFANQKRRKLDLDAGEFGDYFDDSDEDRPRSTRNSSTRRTSTRVSDAEQESGEEIAVISKPSLSAVEKFGGIDSINIRQRLLTLILRFGLYYQQQEADHGTNDGTFLNFEDLLDIYTEFLRPLPLPVFQQFVLPSQRYLPLSWHGNLDQMLLLPLLEGAAPAREVGYLEQPEFEKHFAPYAANGIGAVDNAKVSLIIEDLVLLLRKNGALRKTETLEQAIEQGIKARKAKAKHDGRRKAGSKAGEDAEAQRILACSAERIRAYVQMCS